MQAFINSALIFSTGDLDAAHLFRMINMCPAVGLQVQSDDLHNAHLVDLWRQQVDLCAHQVWNGERLLAWQ